MDFHSIPVLPVCAGIAVLVVAIAHLLFRQNRRERPCDDFPLVSVRDETAQRSFALYGRETLGKGLSEVCVCQVIRSRYAA
jgi:hypothetical protein